MGKGTKAIATKRRSDGATKGSIANRKSAIGNPPEPRTTNPEPSRDLLILSHLDLVAKIAHRYHRRWHAVRSLEDLQSDGYLGLIDAAARFDPKRGVRFNTFASRRIAGAMCDGLRASDEVGRSQRHRGNVTMIIRMCDIEAAAEGSGVRGRWWELPIADLRLPIAGLDASESFATLLRPLTRRQRQLLTLMFVHGLTQAQAARAMGYSGPWASLNYRAAMRTLRAQRENDQFPNARSNPQFPNAQ